MKEENVLGAPERGRRHARRGRDATLPSRIYDSYEHHGLARTSDKLHRGRLARICIAKEQRGSAFKTSIEARNYAQ